MIYLKWLLLFIPMILIELIAVILTPIIALFIEKEYRTDRVKIQGNKQVTMLRDYLIPSLYYFQTHDNAVDEYWYGGYYLDNSWMKDFTQKDYDKKAWLRYWCRCMWMWRNPAYGFAYNWFSAPIEEAIGYRKLGNLELTVYPNSFQLKGIADFKWFRNDVNIGWKEHTGFDRKMMANRIIGIRL